MDQFPKEALVEARRGFEGVFPLAWSKREFQRERDETAHSWMRHAATDVSSTLSRPRTIGCSQRWIRRSPPCTQAQFSSEARIQNSRDQISLKPSWNGQTISHGGSPPFFLM
jgi:hypothetical protein